MSEAQQVQNDEKLLQERWGSSLEGGFLVIPRVLLAKQYALGLDSHELVVLLNLLASWWKKDEDPFPATPTLAARMNVSISTVQRALRKLEEEGFITRHRNVPGTGRARDRLVTRYEMTGTPQKALSVVRAPPPAQKQKAAQSAFNAGRRVRQAPTDVLKV